MCYKKQGSGLSGAFCFFVCLEGENFSVIANYATTAGRKSNLHFLQIPNLDKSVALYSLDVIISVGYRVKSKRVVEFRKWANSVLKQYILKGYAVNNNRIKQLGEVIRIMKRTENELDSKQVLSVIEKYNMALELLDSYQLQCFFTF